MDKIRIMVADDHPAFREGLCRILADEKDLEVVAKAEDGEETVRLAQELCPDVAIIDVAMPKFNGIEAAKQIKAVCPNTAILIVSAYDYQSYLLASMRAGAAGYLLKSTSLREMINAIRFVHDGQAVFDFQGASRVLERLTVDSSNHNRGLLELHNREMEVLKLAAKGKSNKEIAGQLVVSERTIQTHMVNIFRKLGVGSRTEAVLHAFKEGWLTPDDLP